MTAPARRVRRPGRTALIVMLVLVLVAGIAVAAEFAARAAVARVAADEITAALPEGVSAVVVAAPTGACVGCELLGGGLSGLEVAGEQVRVGTVTGSVEATATAIELGDEVRVGGLRGTVELPADEVERLLRDAATAAGVPFGDLELTDGGVRWRSTIPAFGIEIAATIDAKVQIRSGGRVQVQATGFEITGAGFESNLGIDPSSLSLQFCIAERLPALFQLTGVTITPEALAVDVRTTGPFTANEAAFAELGSCRG